LTTARWNSHAKARPLKPEPSRGFLQATFIPTTDYQGDVP
jgi:hypothetical protein